ncbi:MAG: hypothetical protein NC909_01605 [Candidatus Omnitrophica bacterium]|nr:hypothetical protein [Candidatus Omnitrophota bacterium]
MSCLSEAIKNLQMLGELLLEEKRIILEDYINQIKQLSQHLSQDLYTSQFNWYYNRAEALRKNILREFSYPQIKDYLR